MTIERTDNSVNIKLNNAWIAWILFAFTLLGGLVAFVRLADSKVSGEQVQLMINASDKVVEERQKNIMDILVELKADVKGLRK